MKILVFGRGVIGTIYGWALEAAGHEVEFYVRPGRSAVYGSSVRLDLIDVRRPQGDQRIIRDWGISLREDLPSDHDYDMIFVSMTHDRFSEAAKFLSSKASNATIAIFNNFWDDPQGAANGLPQDQLAWGFPGAGGGYQRDGGLLGALFPKLDFGTFGTDPSPREVELRQLFADAGFALAEHRNFREWLLVHFAVSAAVSAQQFRGGSSRREVYWNHDHAMERAVHIIREVMPLLAARGVKIEDHPELMFFNQPEASILDSFKPMLGSPAFQAAIDSHTNPKEMVRMFEDVLEESRRLGIALPSFEAAARAIDRS